MSRKRLVGVGALVLVVAIVVAFTMGSDEEPAERAPDPQPRARDAARAASPDRASPADAAPSDEALPFVEHVRATVAEAEARCDTDAVVSACDSGTCTVRWHTPRAEGIAGWPPYAGKRDIGLKEVFELSTFAWDMFHVWIPCGETFTKLGGPETHRKLAGFDCLIIADPAGPPLKGLDEDVIDAAIDRCRALDFPPI